MPTGRPSVFKSAGVVIVNTSYVVPPNGEAFYEIHTAPDHEPNAQRTVFVTRDKATYEAALFAEGKPDRFDVQWTRGSRPDGKRAQIVLELTACGAERAAS
jgi:hypothetical protein